MTLEEIDILVQANIDGAVKQFKKLLPEVKKQINRVTQEFNRVKIKDITAKIDTSQVKAETKKIGKQIKEAFDPNDISGIKISGLDEIKDKYKGLTDEQIRLSSEMDKISKQMDNFKIGSEEYEILKEKLHELNREYQGLPKKINVPKVELANNDIQNEKKSENVNNINSEPSTKSLSIWDALKSKIKTIKTMVQQIKPAMQQAFSGESDKELEFIKYKISEIQEKLEKAKNGEIKLNSKEIIQAEAEIERLNKKKNKLEQPRKR